MTRGRGRDWLDHPLTWGLGAAAGLALLAAGARPHWWLGAGLLAGVSIVAGPHALRALREARWARGLPIRGWRASAFLELGVVLLLVSVALWMWGDARVLDRPINGDHTAHFTRAWLTKERLLGDGSLFGWTNAWFAGTPHNYLYPPGADLWVLLWYGLGFGQLGFSEAYGLAVFAFFVFQAWAAWRLGRRAFGVPAALLGAVLVLTDPGGGRSGGWQWAIDVGAWPNSLAMAFGLLALAELAKLIETRRAGPLVAFALWMAAAIVTHPMMLFLWAAVLATGILSIGVRAPAAPLRALRRLGAGHLLAAMLSAFWVLRLVGGSDSEHTTSHGMWWIPAHEVGTELVDMTLVRGLSGIFVMLGAAGVALNLFARGRLRQCLALMCVVIVGALNSSTVDTLGLLEVLPALEDVQLHRVLVLLRSVWLLAAAWVVVEGLRRLGAAVPRVRLRPALPAVVLVATLLAPVAYGFAAELAATVRTEDLRPVSTWSRHEPLQKLAKHVRQKLPGGFYRVAYDVGGRSNLAVDMPYRLDRPAFKMRGGTPTVVYAHAPITRDPDVLRAAHVRYGVLRRKPRGGDWERLKRFGRFALYAFRSADGPVDVLEGEGKVRVRRFENDRIVLEAGAGSDGMMRLPVSVHPRWRAYRDGEPVPIRKHTLRGSSKSAFMTLPLAPGRYEVRFEASAMDRVGDALAIVAGLVLLALLLLPRWRRRRGAAPESPAEPTAEPIAAAAGRAFERARGWSIVTWSVLGAVLLAATLLASHREPLRDEEKPGWRVRHDLMDELETARVAVGPEDAPELCPRILDRFVCGPQLWEQVAVRPARLGDKSMERCIAASPQKGGALRVRFEDLRLRGGTLRGHFGIPWFGRKGLRRRPVARLEVLVDGDERFDRRVRRGPKRYDFGVPLDDAPERGSVTFVVHGPARAKRELCFAAQILEPAHGGKPGSP